MADIDKLLNQIAAQETQLQDTEFLAPCVQGGKVRTSVANLIYTFTPQPRDFEGWGIFRPVDEKTAEVVEEASLPQLAEYLKLLKPLRLRLAYPLRSLTWLAYPINESDMQQRLGIVKPVPVHLVSEGAAFEPIIARSDGTAFWFDEIDRRAEPQPTEQLREQLEQVTLPDQVRFAGMTPEMVTVYELVLQQTPAYQEREHHRRQARGAEGAGGAGEAGGAGGAERTDEQQLRDALQMGGGRLRTFRDRGEFWQVEWTTRDGERHTSAIAKGDLTVMSSGICLSGCDRDFDLQSLVGVIEARS
ncbi:hypothetical protein [Coleofasciculus chthonoplastes]|uniref:hypothetical protein n=1 Tax=Coleofasciculus chthonoplastes TaxID=64178 RepID=UPI00030DC22A|nr:hypothetical protein [Coleofasciculus chthonoplastes]